MFDSVNPIVLDERSQQFPEDRKILIFKIEKHRISA